MSRLHFFRSSFVGILVSLVFITGNVHGSAMHCPEHHHEATDEHHDSAPEQEENCHCACHTPAAQPVAPLFAAEAAGKGLVLGIADGFAPDAPPPGIEHPPQLV